MSRMFNFWNRRRRDFGKYDPKFDLYMPTDRIPGTKLKISQLTKSQRVDSRGFCAYSGPGASIWDNPTDSSYKDHPYHQVPLRCPLCNRKLIARVLFGHDCERFFSIPPHKPKGYKIKAKRPKLGSTKHPQRDARNRGRMR